MERNITNEIVTEYINGFYKPLNGDFYALRLKAEEEHVPIILKEAESFLKVFLKITAPKRILEIGCAVGYSAMFFSAVSGADVVTIEKDKFMAAAASVNITRMRIKKKINILEGDGEECMKLLALKKTDPFDMVFIDASKSHYKRFLDAALKLCRPGSIILSDNVLLRGCTASDIYDPSGKYKTNIKKMREYVDFINNDPRIDTSVITCGDGLAISVINNI